MYLAHISTTVRLTYVAYSLNNKQQQQLRDLSLWANYTDLATATCW
jgi:hypothetical protein